MFKRNKKIQLLTFLILIFITLAIWRPDVAPASNPKSKSGLFLGTITSITIYDPISSHRFDTLYEHISDQLIHIEHKMSLNIQGSEVNQINHAAGSRAVSVSPETFSVIHKGKLYSELSQGAFDISIGPIVKLWGIGSDHANLPNEKKLIEKLKCVNYKDIKLDKNNHTVYLKESGMAIDLGGIAKGYAADLIASYLKDQGIENALINLGGNIYALGSKPGATHWNIGIQNPNDVRGKYIGIVHVKNKCVVTSGIYERYFLHENIRYHHILDPFTGYPINNELASISIISDNSIDGDGLSTTIFSLGIDKGKQLIESMKGVDAIFVTKNNEVYLSSGLIHKFTLKDTNFTLMRDE
jgi:thiamine biosynthesis lipoprotein